VRRSAPLPYELAVEGSLTEDRKQFKISFAARDLAFGDRAAGAPFVVYARSGENLIVRNYAVAAGEQVTDTWKLADFADSKYDLAVYGPNGFYRAFSGGADDPAVEIRVDYQRTEHGKNDLNGDIEVRVSAVCNQKQKIELIDNAYGATKETQEVPAEEAVTLIVRGHKSSGWYDFSVRAPGSQRFEKRYAGRVETGKWTTSDPVMGRVQTA
jgi:phospholipase C